MTANPQLSTAFVIVGSKNSIAVQNIVAAGKYNVVGYPWILECIERKAYDFPSMRYVSDTRRCVSVELVFCCMVESRIMSGVLVGRRVRCRWALAMRLILKAWFDR